jgi:NitT/TauT family transport system substrate-binding protein
MKSALHMLVLLGLMLPLGMLGQPPPLEKVKIASGGHIVHFLPLDLAVAKGFFTSNGLDAEIIQLQSGTPTAQALISKQVDFSLNSIDHAFKAAVQGKDDLRMVCLLNRLPGMTLVVDSRLKDTVKSIPDLKGRSLAVTSRGSATHMVLASLLHRAGVNIADVTLVEVKPPTFAAALENKQIAGGIALDPFASVLVQQGKLEVLADLNTLRDAEKYLGGPYNQAGVMTRQDVIDSKPQLVKKVVAAHVAALKWMLDHSPQEIADALPPEVIGSDKAQYVRVVEKLKEFYSPDGQIIPEGVQNVYRSMKQAGALAADVELNPEKFFLNRDWSSAGADKKVAQTKHVPLNLVIILIAALGLGAVIILLKKKPLKVY